MNDDHLHRAPEYPWDAYLQSQAKKENRGRKEPVGLDEPQKHPTSFADSSKNTLVTSPAKRPRIPPKKVLKQIQPVVIKIP
jgi:hypothetical protein